MRPLLPFALCASFFLGAPHAHAQSSIATDDMAKKVMADGEKKREDGWKAKAKVGATFSLNHNSSVVGTDDGLTLQLGAVLSAQANLQDGQHRWENELSLQETQTRTPQLERFVRSIDQLDLISTYIYRFESVDWLGLYGKALFNTQIFPGELVATEQTEVRRVDVEDFDPSDPAANSSLVTTLQPNQSFPLTLPFETLNLRQSLGLFAEPVEEEAFTLGAKLGLGAQEIFGRGSDVTVATPGDGTVIVRPTESAIVELGAEAQLSVTGELLADEVLTYYATVNVFYPPFSTSEIERDFVESLNLRLKAGFSLKLTKALSIDYVLTVLRIPAVTQAFQVQNGLLISAGFDLI